MNEWPKEQLEEMFGDDKIAKLAFLSGCTKHQLNNDPVIPDGYIVTESSLRDFAESIVQECITIVGNGGEFASRPKLIDQINQHFRVED